MTELQQREDVIDQITDLDLLRARLKAAERVCIAAAWAAAPDRKWARGRLEYKWWSEWHTLAGPLNSNVEANRELARELNDAKERDEAYRAEELADASVPR